MILIPLLQISSFKHQSPKVQYNLPLLPLAKWNTIHVYPPDVRSLCQPDMAKEMDAALFGLLSLLGNGKTAFWEVSPIDRNKAMPTKTAC